MSQTANQTTSQGAFFTRNPLPVFEALSDSSRHQLENHMLSGNTAFRESRLLDFFRTIDWIAAGEACDFRPLHKLPLPLQKQLQREIEDYRAQKALSRYENAQKREQYRLRVFEYFRVKMPSADKALLESLRDYELNLTGRDANWRHYFTLDSFKKIDAFIQASHDTRQALFTQFKKDVDTYKRNYDKLHNPPPPAQGGSGEHGFTFDDWCELMGEYTPHSYGSKQHQNKTPDINNPVIQAYETLGLPCNASPEAVKKQFRKLTLSHHPDLSGGSEEKMKTLVNAYHEIQRYWRQSASML